VLGWATSALFGDPVLVLAPPFVFVALMLLVFSLGAPGRPEVLLPLLSLPPIDAFQDVVIIDVAARSDLVTWLLRAAALLIRAAAFGVLLHLAVQRARDRVPSLGEAATFVRRRFSTLAFLELLAFVWVRNQRPLPARVARGDGVASRTAAHPVLVRVGPAHDVVPARVRQAADRARRRVPGGVDGRVLTGR
jgi:hypothetical protein